MADEPRSSVVDELIDEVLPESLDWRGMVTSYPIPALIVAGVAGFFVGREHGMAILEALSGFAAREVDRNVSAFLGDDGGSGR